MEYGQTITKEIPESFRETQKRAGIGDIYRDAFLSSTRPMNDKQGKYIKFLDGILRSFAIDDERPRGLATVLGTKGTGKTYLTQAFVNEFLRWCHNKSAASEGVRFCWPERLVLLTTHFDLDSEYKSAKDKPALNQMLKFYDILVIDEFGRGSLTEYSMTFIESLIISRQQNNKLTILLSNKTFDELNQTFDTAVRDRLKTGFLTYFSDQSLR